MSNTRATRRGARDRVFDDRSTDTTDDFPAPDDEADVVNVSGHPGSQPVVPRPRVITPHVPPRVGRRRQVEIDAQSGQALDSGMAKGLSRVAQHRAQVRGIIEGSEDPAGYLRHLFGLRDR
jgi:hypothetical protein